MLLKFELFCNRKGGKGRRNLYEKVKEKKKVVGDRQNVTEKRKSCWFVHYFVSETDQ